MNARRAIGPRAALPWGGFVLECSLEEYDARYGAEEQYSARLARRLVRSHETGDREVWILLYGDVEPYFAVFSGEEGRMKRRRFPSREAAEAWAAKLLGIDPDCWEERNWEPGVVH